MFHHSWAVLLEIAVVNVRASNERGGEERGVERVSGEREHSRSQTRVMSETKLVGTPNAVMATTLRDPDKSEPVSRKRSPPFVPGGTR